MSKVAFNFKGIFKTSYKFGLHLGLRARLVHNKHIFVRGLKGYVCVFVKGGGGTPGRRTGQILPEWI